MNAHQLENNVIVNTIVVDSLDAFPNLIDASIGGQIGDSIIDGIVVPKTPVKIVPQIVTRRQAIKALFLSGFTYEAVEDAIIAHLPSPHKELALIDWKESPEFHRDNQLVIAMGPLLILSPTDIDNLFITANTL